VTLDGDAVAAGVLSVTPDRGVLRGNEEAQLVVAFAPKDLTTYRYVFGCLSARPRRPVTVVCAPLSIACPSPTRRVRAVPIADASAPHTSTTPLPPFTPSAAAALSGTR